MGWKWIEINKQIKRQKDREGKRGKLKWLWMNNNKNGKKERGKIEIDMIE